MKTLLKSFFNTLFRRTSDLQDPDISLCLHIGMPKTGTTAIQSFLYHNRALLQEQHGIYYPDTALHWYQQVPVVKALISPLFSYAHFNELIPAIDPEHWLKKVITHCSIHTRHKVIISSEFFWASPVMQAGLEYHEDTTQNFADLEVAVRRFHDFFSPFTTIKIVVYLRKQDGWIESFFNQQLKDGFSIPGEREIVPVRNYLLYYKNLQLWARYFGRENIIIRFFEEVRPDIVTDFCGVAGIDQQRSDFHYPKDQEATNQSLAPRAVRIMKLAIGQNLEKDFLKWLRNELLIRACDFTSAGDSNHDGVFSRSFLHQIEEIYRADSEELARLFPSISRYCKNVDEFHLYGDVRSKGGVETGDSEDRQLLESLLADYKIQIIQD